MTWYIAEPLLAARLLDKSELDPATNCRVWKGANRGGYGAIRINGKTRGAHIVSYEVNTGPVPEGMDVCHSCDNPACINPHHLFLGSAKENMADKVAKGRQARLRGVDSGRAKLTEAQICSIRSATGTLREIGRHYGVSHVQVLRIRSGESWSHLTQGAK